MVKIPTDSIGIPELGFGFGTIHYKGPGHTEADKQLVDLTAKAVRKGFVHIDSAEVYGTAPEVHDVLKELSDIDRSKIFITEKYKIGSPDGDPYEHLKAALKTFDTPYVDLYLLHSPFFSTDPSKLTVEKAWKAVEKTLDEGLAKRIGVSNFAVEDLEKVFKIAKTKPQVNQIEFNAFLQNQTPGIVAFSKKNNVVIEAYSPLGPVTKNDTTKPAGKAFAEALDKIAAAHGHTKTQVILRWVIQNGIVPITATSKESRLDELEGVFDFTLTDAEVEQLTKLGSEYKPPLRQYWKPEYGKYDAEL